MEQNDEKYMRLAISEALKALEMGEVPIGAVVIAHGQIIGRGHNLVERLYDATAHAEMQAITAAMSTLGGKYLREATIYVTLEPCPMCAGALAWSQIGRVVWGADDLKKGWRSYSEKLLHPKTECKNGVLREKCEEIMQTFFTKLRDKI